MLQVDAGYLLLFEINSDFRGVSIWPARCTRGVHPSARPWSRNPPRMAGGCVLNRRLLGKPNIGGKSQWGLRRRFSPNLMIGLPPTWPGPIKGPADSELELG